MHDKLPEIYSMKSKVSGIKQSNGLSKKIKGRWGQELSDTVIEYSIADIYAMKFFQSERKK
jgi:hypothetical protein